MARRPSLTPEVRVRFLTAIRAGAGNEVAADYAGISLTTYYRSMADVRPQFRQFWHSPTSAAWLGSRNERRVPGGIASVWSGREV
jgi:hypothetical protein